MLQQPKMKTKDKIIEYLKQNDGVEQKTLQDVLGIKQNSLSMILKRMETKGIIERKPMKLKSTGQGGKLHAKLIFLKELDEKTPKPKPPKGRTKSGSFRKKQQPETNDDMDEGIDFDDSPPQVTEKHPELGEIIGLQAELDLLKKDNVALIDQKVEQQHRIDKLLVLLGEAENKEPVKILIGDVDDNLKEIFERFPDNVMIEELKILIHGQQGQYKVSNTSRYRKPILLYHYGLEKIKGT